MTPQRPPESFHLPLALPVPWASKDEADAELSASDAHIGPSEAAVVVQQDRAWDPSPANGLVQQPQEVLLSFGERREEMRDESTLVIEQTEDLRAHLAPLGRIEDLRPVAGISLPESVAGRGDEAVAFHGGDLHLRPTESLRAQQSSQHGGLELAAGDHAVAFQLADDERHRAAWIFALHGEDQLLDLVCEDSSGPLVAALRGHQAIEAIATVGVEPGFDRSL